MSRFALPNLPVTWKTIPFGQIAIIIYGKGLQSGSRVEKGNIPVYGSNGVIGYHDLALHTKPSIVIGRKGSVGTVQYVNEPFWCIDTAFYLDNIHPLVDLEFLAYILKVIDLSRLSIVVGVPGINRADIEKLGIPIPTLREQQQIVRILRQTNYLHKLRTNANEQSELLATSIFNQVFGIKDKNIPYQYSKLGKIADVVSGVTKGRNLPAHETVNVPYLRVANVQAGYLDLTEIKMIDVLRSDVEKYALQPGDILLTEGGDFDKLGRGAILEQEIANCIHQNHVFRVRVNREILLPLFFHYYLQTVQARQYFLRAAKRTTNLASINITQLNAMPVPVPPLPLQEKFVNSVNQVRSMLEKQAATSAEIDRLFQITLVNAFTGNLTRGFRNRNLLELSRLADERDAVLSRSADHMEIKQDESAFGTVRSLVRNVLSPNQQSLLASIEDQETYLPNRLSEVVGDLTPNEVNRNLELLVQLGLIKAVRIPVTPGKLGQVFYTKTYRSLQPKDNVRDADLKILPTVQEE